MSDKKEEEKYTRWSALVMVTFLLCISILCGLENYLGTQLDIEKEKTKQLEKKLHIDAINNLHIEISKKIDNPLPQL